MIAGRAVRRFFGGLFLCLAVAVRVPAAPADVEFRPLEDFRAGLSKTFDKQNQYTLLAGALVTAAALGWDERARADFAHQGRLGGYEWLGNDILGTGVPGALVGLGLWTWGLRQGAAYEVHAGQGELEALLFTALATEVLKRTVQRLRPDGSDRLSFPSGHTSTMAAAAMALQEFYGWRAGVPAFALTALTAASRMTVDKHWLSDTVGATVLGVVLLTHLLKSTLIGCVAPRGRAEGAADGRFCLFSGQMMIFSFSRPFLFDYNGQNAPNLHLVSYTLRAGGFPFTGRGGSPSSPPFPPARSALKNHQ